MSFLEELKREGDGFRKEAKKKAKRIRNPQKKAMRIIRKGADRHA